MIFKKEIFKISDIIVGVKIIVYIIIRWDEIVFGGLGI